MATTDLSEILPEEIEAEVKLAAEISMGTEVSEEDIANIMHLCDQVCRTQTKNILNSLACCCFYSGYRISSIVNWKGIFIL